jgi:hypothetical protein
VDLLSGMELDVLIGVLLLRAAIEDESVDNR